MNIHASTSANTGSRAGSTVQPERGAINRIMGLFKAGEEEPEPQSQDEALIEQIMRFIVSHDIGVSPKTLTIAHDFVLGRDLHLIRKIREREDSGEAITRMWLEGIAAPVKRSSGAQKLDRVIQHLETNVDSLSDAARTARTATSDYNTALAENERKLTQDGSAGVGEVAGLVREMIDQARVLEDQLKVTEEESKAMRADLREARRLADEDHLTGLPNRRAFETRLREVSARLSDAHPVTVGFCDIDKFKQVNDTHGHDTGDRVLKLVAEHLATASGNGCFVARHGGEEFAVLFDGINLSDAVARLNEARQLLAQKRLKDRRTGKSLGEITFSAGVAACRAGAESGDTLKAADQALYAAKHQGRNRIIASGA